MSSDHIAASPRPQAPHGIFHEPSPNGELAPPPAVPLPGVPAMPEHFIAPAPDEHLRPDAARGAGELGDSS